MRVQQQSMGTLAFALLAPMVWAAHFFSLYITEALLCGGATEAEVVRYAGVVLTGVALALLFVLQRLGVRSTPQSDASDFLGHVSASLTALSALAVLWTAMPLFVLPACTATGG